jgi:hypothetical protein
MDLLPHAPATCLVAQAGTIVVHQYAAKRKLKCLYSIIMYIYFVYMCVIYFLPRLKINHMTGREIIYHRHEGKYAFVLEHGAVADSSTVAALLINPQAKDLTYQLHLFSGLQL